MWLFNFLWTQNADLIDNHAWCHVTSCSVIQLFIQGEDKRMVEGWIINLKFIDTLPYGIGLDMLKAILG